MKAQHTPGPWEVAGTEIWAGSKRITMGRGAHDEKEAAVRNANARLIAAAPELLQACQRALHWIRPLADPDAEFIREAIAKATGKE